MKYIKQMGIILAVTLVAELLEQCLPLPVPASIYGLLLMLILLISGILKLDSVKETADFLIEIMPLMFIPAAVGLLDSYHQLDGILLPMILVVIVTTVVVMAATGCCAQWVIRRGRHGDDNVQRELRKDRKVNEQKEIKG